eukprot:1800431-Pleurochrysis_carterae.AAC.11
MLARAGGRTFGRCSPARDRGRGRGRLRVHSERARLPLARRQRHAVLVERRMRTVHHEAACRVQAQQCDER